ncbi:nucleotide sugar dehydrogenase [Rhizobium laguerreae]|uniref:UDP-N-acetyl-D-galactosamine dehydrogenase n=1 Tax=Rhizobium laguerreae TaxID=1076926 RepID=A0ABR6G469_9HYPH|nr:nucleotide sugar dehydrogenase [Rhizobium laguerreae]MBB3161055.1 UDP-N-acetyl-D-galactosamine dehydrogenase [Rhizobium laguerreae]MBY3363414.1 nucleotide sugar dehydrogenase [Rhizobium laguerreae]OOO51971.1 UDP-N-acetyl-D-galactosamine dehydrogenase [Rhizobium laguerreae]
MLINEKIAVIGLGYVGLPMALALAETFDTVVGFDVKQSRIAALKEGFDETGETAAEELETTRLQLTSDINDIRQCTVFIVAVPTPIDLNRQPDLAPLTAASRTVGRVLKKGDLVIYESTVYPGVTEEICGPVLASESTLVSGVDFYLGYSPERINPGDKLHTFKTIIKVVSGDSQETLDRVASVYEAVVDAGVYRAQSIKVAEAAKVIENTQRDVNIALMNELAIIFEKMDIRTSDVIAASRTKWNFLPFTPGLVGGHCIGVDPYYLTAKAESLGYHPQVILSGRRINDSMGSFVAQKAIKMLVSAGKSITSSKVAILGLTFKEDVPDLRNSRVPDIVNELNLFGIKPIIHDAMAQPELAVREYGITLDDISKFTDVDALILAVPHAAYLQNPDRLFAEMLAPNAVVIDVKSALVSESLPIAAENYWSL